MLVGSNLEHGWFTHKCKSEVIKEVTIQFHRDLFDEKFLHRNQMSFIRNMFEISLRGISFSNDTIRSIASRIINLKQKQGFESVLELMSILHSLSISDNIKTLSDSSFNNIETVSYNSRRIERIMVYLNNYFNKEVSLSEAAKLIGMTDISLSRFFKLRTGKTFVDTLNEVRLGRASRMLIDTTQTITEISFTCGYNNISNFNRFFKKKKGCTPKEFRQSYSSSGVRTFV